MMYMSRFGSISSLPFMSRKSVDQVFFAVVVNHYHGDFHLQTNIFVIAKLQLFFHE